HGSRKKARRKSGFFCWWEEARRKSGFFCWWEEARCKPGFFVGGRRRSPLRVSGFRLARREVSEDLDVVAFGDEALLAQDFREGRDDLFAGHFADFIAVEGHEVDVRVVIHVDLIMRMAVTEIGLGEHTGFHQLAE